MTESISDRVIIRLLNSPLSGCEFFLSLDRTLFIVGKETQLVANDSVPEFPNDTIFIPFEQGGVNFEILLDKTEAHNVLLRELWDEKKEQNERTIPFNEVQSVGGLKFIFRLEHQIWSPEIIYSQEGECQTLNKKKIAVYFIFSLAILFTLVGGYLKLYDKTDKTSLLFEGENERFQMIRSKAGISYIYARTEADVAWAQQVIRRAGYASRMKVVNLAQENERVSYWLADHYPSLAYYRLSLGTDPRQPQLWISAQRNSLDKHSADMLVKGLMEILPYAERVDIISMDDMVAVRQAEAGLQQQALAYNRRDQKDSVTFIIQGELTDEALIRIRFLVDDYYRQWGKRYVKFYIELKDDPFKEYSFQYGKQAYVKLRSGTWHFQNKQQ